MMLRTIFWPPGPLPFRKASSISDSGGGFGRGGRLFADVGGVLEKALEVP